MNTYTITLGQVTNNGVACANPIITLAGHSDSAVVNCIDEAEGIYQVQTTDELAGTSLEFIVQCSECDDCPPTIINVSLCDDNGDCGECQVCGPNGYCVSLCDEGQSCVNDKCVDCTSSEECPHNQVCINGSCGCPDGSMPGDDGRCSDCAENADCEICEVCQSGTCAPKDCVDGVCDPQTGDCIDCLNSGDCDINEVCTNGSCNCAEGFTRINGVCVAVDCEIDGDCPDCFQCSNNNCIPITCPPGKTPAIVNGACSCVPECDPNNPNCPDGTYCAPSQIEGEYGCVPCTGDCDNGCDYPCICSQSTGGCVANNCINTTCVDGTDCGHGCGCKNGECVPCDSLACPGVDCEETKGCGCSGNKCIDSDTEDNCNLSPCEISSDCGFGCTCVAGECTSCDNFSCSGSTCANQDGCKCQSGACVGEDISACTDSISIQKSDAGCFLTGQLTKSECCSCPEISISITPQASSGVAGDNMVLSYKAELRKGAFNSADPTVNNLLGDSTKADIAENETPTAGSLRMTYRNRFNVYSLSYNASGVEVRTLIGTSLSPRQNATSSVVGKDSATLTGSIAPVGTEILEGNTVKVVSEILVSFETASKLSFENGCSYDNGTPIATYTVTANGQVAGDAPKGKGVTSDDCRFPMFKWYKSSGSNFGSTPFRKRYIAGINNTFVDILSSADQGLEPCKTYLLETDCSCAGSATRYVVFCTPSKFNYTLEDCNTKLSFGDAFAPCELNTAAAVKYGVKAGSIDIQFTANSYPAGATYTSTEPISSVEFYQLCGTEKTCAKTDAIDGIDTPINIRKECNGDGTFTATFSPLSTCGITKVVLSDGSQLTSNFSKTLPVGTYTAEVYTDCSCPPISYNFTEQCCAEVQIPNCYKDCDGNLVGCVEDTNVTYTTLGGQEISSLAEFILASTASEATTVLVTRPGCNSKQLNIPPTSESCCGNFRIEFVQNQAGTGGTVTVKGAASPVITVTAQSSQGTAPNITNTGNGVFNITNMTPGSGYDVEATDNTCGTLNAVLSPSDCALDIINWEADDCVLEAEVTSSDCLCSTIGVEAQITAVEVLESTFRVTWTASVDAGGVVVTGGTVTDSTGVNDSLTSPAERTTTISRRNSSGDIVNSKQFTLTISGVSLQNNCEYPDKTFTFSISSNGSATPASTVGATLTAKTIASRYAMFTWDRAGLEFAEYAESKSTIDENTTVNGLPYLKWGATYSVLAECGACSDSETTLYCCEPSVSVTSDLCNKQVTVQVTGAPGEYVIKYAESGGQVTLTKNNPTRSLVFSSQTGFSATTVVVESAIDSACTYSYPLTLQNECTPTLSTGACVGDKYDLTLSGCNSATYTITPSGGSYDQVSGNTVEGIVKNSGISVEVINDATSCEFTFEENVDWDDPCIVACDDKAWTSSVLTYVEGSCVGSAYQDDGSITLSANDTSGTVDKYAVSTKLSSGASVGDFDGDAYASAIAFSLTSGDTIVSGITNGPGAYVVRFYQGSDDCFTAFTIEIPETDCDCQMSYTVAGVQATCSNVQELNNGKVTLSGFTAGHTNVTHYGVSSQDASTYDGPTVVANATAIFLDPEDIVTAIDNVNNNGTGQTSYIVRVFGGNDLCFEDVEVVIADSVCTCGGPSDQTTSKVTGGTCNELNGEPNDDGKVIWKLEPAQASPAADKYHLVEGTSIPSNLTYATATVLPSSTSTQPAGFEYVLKDDVPTAGDTYTFRIYNGDDACYKDFTVTVPGTVCSFDCASLCSGKADGFQCNGPGTQCVSGECVATTSCTQADCTYSGFDSRGCVECKASGSGTPCSDGECDGSGTCLEFTGACCSGSNCTTTTESNCSGTWLGANSNCDNDQFIINQASVQSGMGGCDLTVQLIGNLFCSGCDCGPVSGSLTLSKQGSGSLSRTFTITKADCNTTGVIFYSAGFDIANYFGLVSSGDTFTSTITLTSPFGSCTYSGITSYSDSVTLTSQEAANANSCYIEPEGACCSGGSCTTTTQSDCQNSGGNWDGGLCQTTNSYCCREGYGTCRSISYSSTCGSAQCASDESEVNSCQSSCFPYGACCLPDGSCTSYQNSLSCLNAGGDWNGLATTCSQVDCSLPSAIGACCTGQNCTSKTEADCNSSGGAYLGDNSTCSGSTCFGACCYVEGNTGFCYPTTEANCAGGFQGYGTLCEGNICWNYWTDNGI